MPDHPVTERVLRGTANSPLPPSVEAAYYRKCIELKRRVEEIETNNDKYRLSINRHSQAIKRLRLERAFLIDAIIRETDRKKNGPADPESEDSESIPPTPQEKPVRTKKPPKTKTGASSPPPQASSDQPTGGASASDAPPSGTMAPGPTISSLHAADANPATTGGGGSSSSSTIPGTASFRTYPAPPAEAETNGTSRPSSDAAPYPNGTADHAPAQEDVTMTEAPGAAGGFTAVNRSG